MCAPQDPGEGRRHGGIGEGKREGETAPVTRNYPGWIIGARVLGTAALVGALALSLQPRPDMLWLGGVLIAVFLVLRLGAAWFLALRFPDPAGLNRRSAILTSVLALAAVAFWFYVRSRGAGA